MDVRKVLTNLFKKVLNNTSMKKISCINWERFLKSQKTKNSSTWNNKSVLFTSCAKCTSNDGKIFKVEYIEILKTLSLINSINKHVKSTRELKISMFHIQVMVKQWFLLIVMIVTVMKINSLRN